MADIFAITTRGLESITAREMAALDGVTVRSTSYRRVEAECKDLSQLSRLRTVDDVFLKLHTWSIGHQRAELDHIAALSAELDIEAQLSLIQQVRPVPESLLFSVTANFVGKRNYSTPEIKESVADGVLGRYLEWRYSEDDDESELNLRIFMEHEQTYVGLRIFKHPLHRRVYKLEHLPGSLKPPVAAALTQIAGLKEGMRVLDGFCGAGTILIECAQLKALTVGGDIDPEAARMALNNAANADVRCTICHWNAAQLPLPASSVDCAISNLPWGRQVIVDDSLRTLYQAALQEMRRVVKHGGNIVLLTTLPELLDGQSVEQFEISLYGQNPTILRLVN